MKYYNDKITSGDSFEDRIGEPEKFDASLGKIVEGFSFLEEALSNIIILLLGVENDLGYILTAELSYKNKINLFASLIKYNIEKYKKTSHDDIETQFKELLYLCNKAEELRNQIIHSNYVANRYRIKLSAKAKKGLKKTIEEINPDYLLDIADFIIGVGTDVEGFPLILGFADTVRGSSECITYFKKNKIIKQFNRKLKTSNNSIQRTATSLRSIAAGEIGR